jgi:hypothetical protein
LARPTQFGAGVVICCYRNSEHGARWQQLAALVWPTGRILLALGSRAVMTVPRCRTGNRNNWSQPPQAVVIPAPSVHILVHGPNIVRVFVIPLNI